MSCCCFYFLFSLLNSRCESVLHPPTPVLYKMSTDHTIHCLSESLNGIFSEFQDVKNWHDTYVFYQSLTKHELYMLTESHLICTHNQAFSWLWNLKRHFHNYWTDFTTFLVKIYLICKKNWPFSLKKCKIVVSCKVLA